MWGMDGRYQVELGALLAHRVHNAHELPLGSEGNGRTWWTDGAGDGGGQEVPPSGWGQALEAVGSSWAGMGRCNGDLGRRAGPEAMSRFPVAWGRGGSASSCDGKPWERVRWGQIQGPGPCRLERRTGAGRGLGAVSREQAGAKIWDHTRALGKPWRLRWGWGPQRLHRARGVRIQL